MSYMGDEDYDYERSYRRRPSPRRMTTETRRSQQFLNPNLDSGGLYRTRSQGHGPVPVVNVYNDVVQDANVRNSSRSPPYPPYPPSPEQRGRRSVGGRLGDDLAEDFADLALENRRLRSRSRGRSDASDRRSDYYEWELRQRDRELRELERRASADRSEERFKSELEMQRLRDEAKRKADEAERRRIIEDYERKQREDEEDRKEEEKRLREKIEREKYEKEEREKREWNEFLQKQREKKEREEAEKRAHEEELEEEMRRRLSRSGMPHKQIEAIINEDREKKRTITTTTTTIKRTGNEMDLWQPSRAPVYAKIHRDYLAVDTLRYYDVPYEYDRNDHNYIIVLREMDKYETEVLFEHTRRLRAGKLLLEPAKEKPQYAWYRKRDRSSSRVKKLGILEFK